MTNPIASIVLAATAPLAVATVTLAQDHEPMRLTLENRGIWVDIEDPLWGVEPYDATFDGSGVWLESGSRSNGGATGEAGQWTNIAEDYIGGFLYSEVSSFGGNLERSGTVLHAMFDIERTGTMRALADFGGIFSEDSEETHVLVKLRRMVDGDGAAYVFDWSNAGVAGQDAARSESTTELIFPGSYYFYVEVKTEVHGVEIQPDLGSMEVFTSLEIDRLPDCGEPGAGTCSEVRSTPSCDDAACCESVCEIDPFCCSTMWDQLCVAATEEHCGPCDGDLNQDGTVDGADQGLLFAAWGPQSPTFVHPADFNRDGVVDGVDLGILFSHWGDC